MTSLLSKNVELASIIPYLVFFVIWMAIGVGAVWKGVAPLLRGDGSINSRHVVTGFILIALGVAAMFAPRYGEEWITAPMLFGVGILMIFGGASSIHDSRRCTVYVSAHIVRLRRTRSKHGTHYYATVRYHYQGRTYESECFQQLLRWQVKSDYAEGSAVWAYICPEKPMLCVFDNTVRATDVISIAVGIALIVGGIGFSLGGGF